MQAVLSSNNTVGVSLIEDIWQVRQMCPIIDLNQTHSLLASCKAKISKWLREVATMVYFTDLQEIGVPPYKNT